MKLSSSQDKALSEPALPTLPASPQPLIPSLGTMASLVRNAPAPLLSLRKGHLELSALPANSCKALGL